MRAEGAGEVRIRGIDEAADGGKRHIACAQGEHPRELPGIRIAIDAITRIGTLRSEQPLLLVMPQRSRAHPGFPCHLADGHVHGRFLPQSRSKRIFERHLAL